MNFWSRHIGDIIRDTVSLTMLEDGAYNRLLDQYYQTERPLPLDKKMIYRLARATTTAERKACDFVIETFFRKEEDGYHQKRCDAEIATYQEKQRKAQASANARWSKSVGNANAYPDADANASETHDASDMRTHSEGNASHKPVTNSQEKTGEQQHNHSGQSRALSIDAELPERHVQVAVLLRGLGVMPMTGSHPLAMVFANAGATDEQLRAAVDIARQRKPAPQSIAPGYLQPILQDVLNPPASRQTTAAATRDADRANTIAVLTGRSNDHERTAHTVDVEARRVE